jgi:hypothetical protein
MMLETVKRILPMVAKIKQDQFVLLAQSPPEGKVAVDGKAVAVAQSEPRTGGIAVLPYPDDGTVVHRKFDAPKRCGKLDTQFMLL